MTTAINHTHHDNKDLEDLQPSISRKAHQRAVPSKITAGLKAAIAETDRMEDESNPGNTRVITKDGLFRAYLYKNQNGGFCAAGYRRRSKKTCFRYFFKDKTERDTYVKNWLQECVRSEARYGK